VTGKVNRRSFRKIQEGISWKAILEDKGMKFRRDLFRRSVTFRTALPVSRPLFCLLLSLAVAALILSSGCRPPGESAAASEAAPDSQTKEAEKEQETLVIVTLIERGPINSYIEVSSDIESLYVVDVYPQIGGFEVVEVAVDEGYAVKTGDLLAKLDSEEILLELRQAEVEYAEAEKQKSKSAIAVREAEERWKTSEIEREKLYADYKASEEIAKDGLVSDKDLASDRLLWEQSQSECALRLLEKQKAVLDGELSATAAQKAAIARDNSALRLRRTEIRSPIDGCISLREVDVGMAVTTATRIFTIVDRTALISNLFLPQEDLSRIRQGMPVTFNCDAFPGREFEGEADLVSPVVDPTNGTVKVRVRIPPDEDGLLRPGMFINAKVLVLAKDNALLTTRKAVFYEDESPCVFIVEDDAARKVFFDRGASTDEVIEITNAVDTAGSPIELDESTQIIMVGQDNLKDGDKIKIVEEQG